MANKVTRKKVIDRIPFSFGIIQRIADDLGVTRAAVSQFVHQQENEDLIELILLEQSRIHDYARMNVFEAIVNNDLETTKWYMATYPAAGAGFHSEPQRKYKKNYANDLKDRREAYTMSSTWEYSTIRGRHNTILDKADAHHADANTRCLMDKTVEQLKLDAPQPAEYKTYNRKHRVVKLKELDEKKCKPAELLKQ